MVPAIYFAIVGISGQVTLASIMTRVSCSCPNLWKKGASKFFIFGWMLSARISLCLGACERAVCTVGAVMEDATEEAPLLMVRFPVTTVASGEGVPNTELYPVAADTN